LQGLVPARALFSQQAASHVGEQVEKRLDEAAPAVAEVCLLELPRKLVTDPRHPPRFGRLGRQLRVYLVDEVERL
jgi:hypothetical protein